ncbi:hypothetical protein [Lacticaseibacillus porcinae]|uniref:hypothetical protein n=1 Tax=Lacticaseibacillus porcinae TaxID=1123687 RepID=UPI000F7B0D65|nr:hypothetical protein [Lacticaseibacillus porcinae]
MNEEKLMNRVISIPSTYQLVSCKTVQRNGDPVLMLRYQPFGVFQENGPRIIGIFDHHRVLSLKQLTVVPASDRLSTKQAPAQALKLFQQLDAEYAKGLSFIRVEDQRRSFINATGETVVFPVLWVKFGHQNGTYNWVTFALDGTMIEMEIESQWDYFRGRRATEMWDNDDWVNAREEHGPQLPSPNALA